MTNHSSDSMISSITKELNMWGRKQEKDGVGKAYSSDAEVL